MRRSRPATLTAFDALSIEGALIAPAMMARIAARKADGQGERDYRIRRGLTLRDEVARFFRIGQALYTDLKASRTPSHAATIAFVEALLAEVFEFPDVRRVDSRILEDRLYPVTLEALGGRVPVVVVPPADGLDRASDALPSDGRRRSAASAVQDWLNASDAALWGLCCNGETLRLVRDNASLTRPAFIEADLRQMFEGEAFADFTTLWLLLHASRFGAADAPPGDCALERWREAGAKEGVEARDRLRDGVEAALLALGTGFLSANPELRRKVAAGELPLMEVFGQLKRLVYRLIFLLVAEDRALLHPLDTPAPARRLYAEGYSLSALRDRAVRRSAWDSHHDKWQGLGVVFTALGRGEPRLGLTALGGLFSRDVIPDLETAQLSNRALMEAIWRLAWLREPTGLVPVNWRDMETEELGSVYESLLELTPRLSDDGRALMFAEGGETRGNARKTTGSYYTPDALVQALLDSALDPVLARVEAEAADPAQALLAVTVLDPACGSGHFLLAAARRIATRLARIRAGGIATADDFRHALRDVVRSCIHGVDRNPMAVELTKVALWIETVDPGKPLGFLDANIRCGDALLGVADLSVLKDGIPDAAYKPLTGDDKGTARDFAKRNKDEKKGQGLFDLVGGGGTLPPAPPLARAARDIRRLPEDDLDQVAERRRRHERSRTDPRSWSWTVACDLYVAAFLMPKSGGMPANPATAAIPTTGHVWQALSAGTAHGELLGRTAYHEHMGRALDLAREARAFHWPLEFPDVIEAGGFDVVLGNPPWERIKLQEQEFFAARDAAIAEASNAAARGRLIAALAKAEPGSHERVLHEAFETAKRIAEASSVFARVPEAEGGRFPLTGRGDVNTYALFAEMFTRLMSERGRAGVIVPTGIATDATTAPFFASLITNGHLVALYSFENEEFIFPAIHHSMKFCLSIFGVSPGRKTDFVFFARQTANLQESERHFSLSTSDIVRINPNTRTAPIFRSRTDAELAAKIYARVPVLIADAKGPAGNPWGISFMSMFHMSSDSGLFRTAEQLRAAGFVPDGTDWRLAEGVAPRQPSLDLAGGRIGGELALIGGGARTLPRYAPLYEAKMIHQFDHRFGSYEGRGDDRGFRVLPDTSLEQYANHDYDPVPFYFVPQSEIQQRLPSFWKKKWLLAFKDVTAVTNERTAIFSAIPVVGVGHSSPLVFLSASAMLAASLLANLNSLVADYCTRTKMGGVHLTYSYLKQLPVLPPSAYTEADLAFIVPRVLELTYTSHSMAPFARDLGYDGPPFAWDENRRALLRAELDAWYARAYGLTRDELRYILDPADVKGPDYPSETFRVLKKNEIARFGEYWKDQSGTGEDKREGSAKTEASSASAFAGGQYESEFGPAGTYRTARLVLYAWDQMERGILRKPSACMAQAPQRLPALHSVGDRVWATPVGLSQEDIVLFAMIDVLRHLDGPTSWERVHMAVTMARKPALALPFLNGENRAAWKRVIGVETEPLATNVVSLAQFQPNRSDRAWSDVEGRLLGSGALVIHAETGFWAAGATLPSSSGEPWMEGRAAWAVHLLAPIETAMATQNIVSFIRDVEGGRAARYVS